MSAPPLAEPSLALELGLVWAGAAVLAEEDFVLLHPSASAQPALSARAMPAVRSSVLLTLTLFSGLLGVAGIVMILGLGDLLRARGAT